MNVEVNNPFVSLRHKPFRMYWLGMCISLTGTWMQNIAQPWLAYSMTGSPFLLSLIGTLQFTPMLFLSLHAGVLIDRFPKRKILILTQMASMVITLILALLVWSGRIEYWHILVMATLLGIVNTLDMPTRQSFVIELVGKEHLMNAIALNSLVFNMARIIGPALAGLVMGYMGIAICFLINALSYLAVVISLLLIPDVPFVKNTKGHIKVGKEIKDGLKYISKSPVLLKTLVLVGIIATFIPNFNILVPVFAKEILGQNEQGFGLLMSFMGVGSLLGALLIAGLSRLGPNRLLLYVIPWITGVLMVIMSMNSHFLWMGFLLALTGLAFVIFSSSANSTMQLNTSNEYRGRVMSVYTLIFAGSTPFGNLFAGFMTEHFGGRGGFMACGLSVMLLMGIFYGIRHRVQKMESS